MEEALSELKRQRDELQLSLEEVQRELANQEREWSKEVNSLKREIKSYQEQLSRCEEEKSSLQDSLQLLTADSTSRQNQFAREKSLLLLELEGLRERVVAWQRWMDRECEGAVRGLEWRLEGMEQEFWSLQRRKSVLQRSVVSSPLSPPISASTSSSSASSSSTSSSSSSSC
eukprot:GILI01009708.1.p1 GENE.GILI01009708.1~~GILI01009708.1.p1  ORF type:complete len:172 (+),score=28.72 GILI01009708.1:329-844(+)